MEELRIGILSDVHLGPDTKYQAGTKAPELISNFVNSMKAFRPHLVVDLGDRVNNAGRDSDSHNLQTLISSLREIGCSLRYVLGNHDLVHLGVRQNEKLIGQRLTGVKAEVYEGVGLLFVNSEEPKESIFDGELLRQGLASEGRVDARGRPVIIFSHRPLLPVPLAGHVLFAPSSMQHCSWGEHLMDALTGKGWQPLCINGHLHWNHVLMHRPIIQVSIPSLVETWESGEPAGSFAELTLGSELCQINVRGRLPAHYIFHVRSD